MTQLMRFHTLSGSVVVEVGDDEPGFERVDRGKLIADTRRRLDEALADVREAAANTLRTFRTGSLRPDAVEVEFGVKINAEAGAVIAKTALEGHFKVRLSWNGLASDDEPDAEADAGPSTDAS